MLGKCYHLPVFHTKDGSWENKSPLLIPRTKTVHPSAFFLGKKGKKQHKLRNHSIPHNKNEQRVQVCTYILYVNITIEKLMLLTIINWNFTKYASIHAWAILQHLLALLTENIRSCEQWIVMFAIQIAYFWGPW